MCALCSSGLHSSSKDCIADSKCVSDDSSGVDVDAVAEMGEESAFCVVDAHSADELGLILGLISGQLYFHGLRKQQEAEGRIATLGRQLVRERGRRGRI
jgi:hypothetical protein